MKLMQSILLSLFSCVSVVKVQLVAVDATLFASNWRNNITNKHNNNGNNSDNINHRGVWPSWKRSFVYNKSCATTTTVTIPRGGESSEIGTSATEIDSVEAESISDIKNNNDEEEDDNDNEEVVQEELESKLETDSLVFAPSKTGDGSESDPDGLPTRFLRMQKGDREKAKASFIATVKWREEHEVNTIISRPHPKFDLCKRMFPVYIPGRDLSNNVIVVQRVGMIDFDLGHHNNITGDDLLMNYVYIVEYCWNILEPGPPDGVMTTVMDLKNVRFATFRDKEIRSFLKKFVKTMSDHYPQRSHKTLIINAPSWVNMAYKLVKPLLRESTRKKITLLNGGPAQDKALIDILGKDSVPREILCEPELIEGNGESENSGHTSSKVETDMRLLVLKQLEKNNVVMQEITQNDD